MLTTASFALTQRHIAPYCLWDYSW